MNVREGTRRRARVLVVMLAAAALAVGLIAPPAHAGTVKKTVTTLSASTTGTIVKSGPGYVIVGEGSRVGAAGPVTINIVSTGKVTPMSVSNCGWVTCSVYLSRSQTKWLNTNIAAVGGIYAAGGSFCGLAALISGIGAVFVGIGCGAVWAAYGGFIVNAVSRAAADNGCLRIRYPVPLAFYDDHSGYCHNT